MPSITSAPSQINYGLDFTIDATVPFGQSVSKVVLVSPGSLTHGHDPNQRYVQLSFVENDPGTTVIAPTSRSLVPPGWYMLFVVSSAGTPSTAAWVHLNS